MRRSPGLRSVILIGVIVTALVVAACSSSTPPTPTTAPTATAIATPTPAETATPATPPTSSPKPSPKPTPSPTPAPTHTPTVEPPPTAESPTDREVQRLTEVAMGHLRWLSETLGPRASTTVQEKQAADYIAERFRGLGYQTSLQQFAVRVVERSFRILTPVERTLTTTAMAGSGQGDVTAPIVFTGLGRPQDFPEGGLNGAISLIRRGQIQFRDKAENALRAGASGVVIFNNLPGLFNGTLGTLHEMPVLAISLADGETLVELIEEGAVSATLRVMPSENPSNNVVAVKGPSANRPIVVLGAHYDSVPISPGANDNASGTAVLLAIAQEVAQLETPLEIRLIAFGSEELGLLGSRHYVNTLPEEERGRIVAMVNLDALAAGGLVVGGDDALVQQALEIARVLELPLVSGREPPNASSDHASFRSVGIPVTHFGGGDHANIHSPDDTVGNISPEQLGQAGAIASRLLKELPLDQG